MSELRLSIATIRQYRHVAAEWK